MQNISSKAQTSNSIRATFKDGISTFHLPGNATVREIAGRLAHLANRHQGRAIAFDIRLGSLS